MMLNQLPPLRDVIAKYELNARKSLGQNFLMDLNLTTKIARMAGNLKNYDILEIGPGPGGLTRGLLLEGARKLVVIERDERCIPALKEIKNVSGERLEIISGDALSLNPLSHMRAPIKVVANLPYNIGTELLIRWLTPNEWPPSWESLTLMFQKEVAHRIVAKPGSKSYGRLSILAQWRSNAKIVMEIPPQAFTPPPKVTSAVVHITKCDEPKFPADRIILERVVAKAFGQRRKMLRASLRGLHPNIETILKQCDIKPTERAENLSIEEFCKISRAI